MTEKKQSFTPEEEALIIRIRDKYIRMQTEQQPFEDIQLAVNKIWDMMELPHPKVIVMDSPASCKKACPDLAKYSKYWFLWYCSYVVMYDFASQIGLEMDKEKLETFLLWNRCCPFVLFNEDTVYVSKKPEELHFNDNQVLHNDAGMSVRYADDWGIWTFNGVSVDEQIIMKPETQTIEQIREEQNEEVKRIRIERYGWDRYFDKIGAKLVDSRSNGVEGNKEYLFTSEQDGMTALMCICPSTGKEFVLEVPPTTKKCKEAQTWLSSGTSDNIIHAS